MSEIKRLNYFTSQFLVAKDFSDEQKYHREMRRMHNQRLHAWGIVEGLEVTPPKGNDRSVVVSPGMAIDNQGREIVVTAETPVDLSDWGFDLSPPTRPVAFVYAEYKEEPCDAYAGNGPQHDTRLQEKAEIGASAEYSVAEHGAKIILAAVGPAYQVDTMARRNAGLNPNTEITARKLTVTQDTMLKGGLTVADGAARFNKGLTAEDSATFHKGLTVKRDADFEQSINFGERHGELLTLFKGTCAIGVQALTVYARTVKNFAWYRGGTHMNEELKPGENGARVMSLTSGTMTVDGVEIGPGLTIEDSATIKRSLTVQGDATLAGNLKLGGFSTDETNEFERMTWLRDAPDGQTANNWDEKLIKVSAGHFKHATVANKQRAGFGIHMHKSREFGIWSTGPVALFSVEGDSGNTWAKGDLTVDKSLKFGSRTRELISLFDPYYAIGIQASTLYARTHANFAWYQDGKHSDTELAPGGPVDNNDTTIQGKRLMSLTDHEVKQGQTLIAPAGLTVEVDATFKKSLKVEGAAIALFSVEGDTGNTRIVGDLTVQRGIRQEQWQEVGPNGRVNFEHSWEGQAVAFFKDSLGIVHLRGLVKNKHDHEGSCMFKLPAGYVPAISAAYIVAAGTRERGKGWVFLEIRDGQVKLHPVENTGTLDEVYLDGVTFTAN